MQLNEFDGNKPNPEQSDDIINIDVVSLEGHNLGRQEYNNKEQYTYLTESGLNYHNLTNLNLADLAEHYKSRGFNFISRDEYIQKIRTDWSQVSLNYIEQLQKTEENFPSPELCNIEGREYTIYGGYHAWNSGKDYHTLFEEALKKHENILYEQGMGRVFKYPKRAIPIADWSVASIRDFFSLGLHLGLRFPKEVWSLLNPFQGKKDLAAVSIPQAINNEIDGLPEHLVLEMQQEEGVPLDFFQARSAYQAMFMRFWREDEDKAVHVGGAHSVQINFFLKNGVSDQEICTLAQKHAKLAEENPLLYSITYYGSWAKALISGLAGCYLGAGLWIGAGYLLYSLL